VKIAFAQRRVCGRQRGGERGRVVSLLRTEEKPIFPDGRRNKGERSYGSVGNRGEGEKGAKRGRVALQKKGREEKKGIVIIV